MQKAQPNLIMLCIADMAQASGRLSNGSIIVFGNLHRSPLIDVAEVDEKPLNVKCVFGRYDCCMYFSFASRSSHGLCEHRGPSNRSSKSSN